MPKNMSQELFSLLSFWNGNAISEDFPFSRKTIDSYISSLGERKDTLADEISEIIKRRREIKADVESATGEILIDNKSAISFLKEIMMYAIERTGDEPMILDYCA